MLLPAFAEIGAADAGGELGPKRDQFAAAVLERIHFLGDDVGGLADRPREHGGLLDRRHLDPLEPVQPAHAIERRDHRRQAVGVFSKQALRAPDGLNRRHCRALKHKFSRMRNQRVGCGLFCSRSRMLAEEARRRQEQFPEADHDRPAKRIEQVGLIIERHLAGRSRTLGLALKTLVDVEPERASAQPRMLERELRLLTEVREQPQIECADRREVQIVAGQRVLTLVPLRQLAPMRAPRPLFDQPACASTWWRGVPPACPAASPCR